MGRESSISVITVCKNVERTIEACCRSVDEQTCRVEHVIVDGASTDRTLHILKKFGSQTRSVVSEPDSGIYHAMNKGADRATSAILGFLNADDVFANPDSIRRVAEVFEDPAVSIVYGDLEYVDQSGHTVVREWTAGPFRVDRLYEGWMPPHPTFYIRKNLFHTLGGFRQDLQISGDYDFMIRSLQACPESVRYVPFTLVRMRMGGVSTGSIGGLLVKAKEDFRVIRENHLGGVVTLALKVLTKANQVFLGRLVTANEPSRSRP